MIFPKEKMVLLGGQEKEVGIPLPAGGTILAAGKDSQRQWRAAMSSHGCLGDLAYASSFSALVFSSVQWECVSYSYRATTLVVLTNSGPYKKAPTV